VADCIYSAAGIRGVSSARCRVTLNTDLTYRTALCSVTRNRSVVALTVSRWLFLVYLPLKYIIHFRWCRLSCAWYIPSILSSTLYNTSHSLKCRLLNLHYHEVSLYTPMMCVKFHMHLQYAFSVVCLSNSSRNYFSGY